MTTPAYRQPDALKRYNAIPMTASDVTKRFNFKTGSITAGDFLSTEIKDYKLTADETLALIHREKPGNEAFLDVIAGNDKVKNSFANVLARDPSFANNLDSMTKGAGALSPDKLREALKTPGAAEALSTAIDNIGKEIPVNGVKKKVGFAEFKAFTDSSMAMAEGMDPNFMKGKSPDEIAKERAKRQKDFFSSMEGVGVDKKVLAGPMASKAGMDIFMKMLRGDSKGAIGGMNDLMLAGGMDPEQVKAIMEALGPLMGFMSAAMKPYAEFGNFYGPKFGGWLERASGGAFNTAAAPTSAVLSHSTGPLNTIAAQPIPPADATPAGGVPVTLSTGTVVEPQLLQAVPNDPPVGSTSPVDPHSGQAGRLARAAATTNLSLADRVALAEAKGAALDAKTTSVPAPVGGKVSVASAANADGHQAKGWLEWAGDKFSNAFSMGAQAATVTPAPKPAPVAPTWSDPSGSGWSMAPTSP